MTTVLTLALDDASQKHFDTLRQRHFPAHRNQIAAHLTLFHALPDTEHIRAALLDAVATLQPFAMQVKGLMSLGRGVAYTIESPELIDLHRQLAGAFDEHLIPQDRQRFRPHIVVQNKVTAPEAKALLAQLSSGFSPWQIEARGLAWWDYLGGPWKLREAIRFAS